MPSQTVVSLIRGRQIWTLLESTFSLLRLSNAQAGKCKFTLLNRHACIFKHKYLLNITFYKKWLIYLINDIDCLMQVSRCNIIFSMLDFFFFFLHFWISLIYSACPYLWIKSFCSLKRIASIKTFCHFCFFLLFYILYLFFTYVFIHYRICSFFTVYWICGLKSFFPCHEIKIALFFWFW